AERFAGMGLQVERRDALGSPFPQRAAPWIGWLGYGFSVTSAYGLMWLKPIAASLIAVLPLLLGFGLFELITSHGLRPGRRRPPLKSAPVVVASIPSGPPPPLRVVFQAAAGGMTPSLFHITSKYRFLGLDWIAVPLFVCLAFGLLNRIGIWFRPDKAFNKLA